MMLVWSQFWGGADYPWVAALGGAKKINSFEAFVVSKYRKGFYRQTSNQSRFSTKIMASLLWVVAPEG